MTMQLVTTAITSNARRANVYERAGRRAEGEAFANAAQRMHQHANRIAGLRDRCRHCGYSADEHDFDGKCPVSDDDAAYYREQNT